jgi:HEAT repeat protein
VASRKLEERVEQLRQLRTVAAPAEAVPVLRKALADRSNLVVAEAAKTIAELGFSDCVPDMLAAFARLFEDPVKTDPKCWGKTAIVRALTRLDYSESEPFLRGLHHVQKEPVYGGQEDAAPHLRASCALAIVQCRDLARIEMLRHLVDALSDPADAVRVEAVRALNQAGGDEAVLLLRLKARTGDPRPLIVGHAFDALLSLERDRSVGFVAEYLKCGDEELRDEAALALGGSRLGSAVKVLIEAWPQTRLGDFSDTLLRAISSSRLPEAIEFLLNIVSTGSQAQSAAAVQALKLHEASPEIQAQIEEALGNRQQS